jgi:sugar phosphate isomerase/epimerase
MNPTLRQTARVIFSTGSLYVMDLAHTFELAAEAGFDGMEVMCDERWSTRDPLYLRCLSERHGLPVRVVHSPFSIAVPGWPHPEDEVDKIRRSLALAEVVGAETLVLHTPTKIGVASLGLGTQRTRLPWFTALGPVKRWIEGELSRVQEGTTVKIAIENMPLTRFLGCSVDPSWWSSVSAWSQVHRWLVLDTTHWATRGIAPLSAYQAAQGRVCHVHLSNYDGHEHCLPQTGQLDLGAFLRTLAADAYDGTVCVELHPEALAFQDDAALRRNLKASLEFCRHHIER